MNGSFSESDVLRCIHIGLLCVQGNPADRPVMSSVVMMLGSDTVALQAPSKPAFYARNGGANSGVAFGVSACRPRRCRARRRESVTSSVTNYNVSALKRVFGIRDSLEYCLLSVRVRNKKRLPNFC